MNNELASNLLDMKFHLIDLFDCCETENDIKHTKKQVGKYLSDASFERLWELQAEGE